MSDEVAAEAPVETPAEAPVEKAEKPVEAKEAKPRTIDDDLEDVLKKHGGYKFKAAGKDRTVTAAKDLGRMLSRVGGIDDVANDAAKAKEEAAALKAKKDGIKKLKGAERARAIAEFFEEDPTAMREHFAEDILADVARQEERAKLSERERQMADELDQYKSKAQKLQEEQDRAERQREEEAFVARVQQTGERLEKVAVGALTKAKIPGAAAGLFLPAIARRLDRNERLGLGLDEEELAGVVVEEHGQLADQFYGSLDVAALADRLEAQMQEDPDKPGEKVSKLRALMRECARRIKAKTGAPVAAAPVNGHRPPVQKLESDADKLNFWRR